MIHGGLVTLHDVQCRLPTGCELRVRFNRRIGQWSATVYGTGQRVVSASFGGSLEEAVRVAVLTAAEPPHDPRQEWLPGVDP